MSSSTSEHPLLCHPATPDRALRRVAVRLDRGASGWRFIYRLSGDVDRLRLPAPQPPGPTDGLWRQTCCEAFVGVAGKDAYREFNFSPSGQWAAYAFRASRQRADDLAAAAAPRVAWRRDGDALELVAAVDAAWLPAGPVYDIGLAVVAEAADGALAYWALKHPSAQPDFHQRAAFALRVADSPGRPA